MFFLSCIERLTKRGYVCPLFVSLAKVVRDLYCRNLSASFLEIDLHPARLFLIVGESYSREVVENSCRMKGTF